MSSKQLDTLRCAFPENRKSRTAPDTETLCNIGTQARLLERMTVNAKENQGK
jgi:hypothetical protein